MAAIDQFPSSTIPICVEEPHCVKDLAYLEMNLPADPAVALLIYPNKLKNWDFPDAEQARFDSEKTDLLLDIGVVFSGSKMACSVTGKTNSSACLGIYQLAPSLFDEMRTHSAKPTYLSESIHPLFTSTVIPKLMGKR